MSPTIGLHADRPNQSESQQDGYGYNTMKIGLSLYEALSSYIGLRGMMMNNGQFDQLISLIVGNLRHAQTQNILMRLDQRIMPNFRSGITFLAPSEMAMPMPQGWQKIQLDELDALSMDKFLIVDDTSIPFVLVGQQIQNQMQVIVSTDIPMIDGAKSLLVPYRQGINQPRIITNEGYRRAGYLMGQIANQYGSNFIGSWLSKALSVTQAALFLRTAMEVIGAVWVQWRSYSAGSRPQTLQQGMDSDGTYQIQRIKLSDGSLFEAIGLVQSRDFIQACHTVAGLLEIRREQFSSANSDHAANGSSNDELLNNFSIDDFIAQNQLPDFNGNTEQPSNEAPTPSMMSQAMQIPPEPIQQPNDPVANFDLNSFDFSFDAFPMPDDYDTAPTAASHNENGNGATLHAVEDSSEAVVLDTPEQDDLAPMLNNHALSFVSGQISSLRDDILDSGIIRELQQNTRSVLQKFVNESSDLLMLIDELLYIQRIHEQVQADWQKLDLSLLLDALVMTYAGEGERRGVQLSYDMPDDIPDIEGSAEALNRALMILIEHGFGSAEGGGRVEINVQVKAGEWVELIISDSGPLLTQEQLKQLFALDLAQAEATGLGFATLQAIARAHKSELETKQANGMNVFSLRFPI